MGCLRMHERRAGALCMHGFRHVCYLCDHINYMYHVLASIKSTMLMHGKAYNASRSNGKMARRLITMLAPDWTPDSCS